MVIRNASTLLRWSMFKPGTRMPDSLDELTFADQLALSNADVELHALLGNTATAELEMAALNNELAATPIPQADREAAANRAEAERLIAEGAFPQLGHYTPEGSYVEGREGNFTNQMRVKDLAPDLYERQAALMSAAKAQQQSDPSALTTEGANFVQARLASRNAVEAV
jgi:hypothetical protein